MRQLTTKAKKVSQKRAKEHVNNEAIYRRIEAQKLKLDEEFAKINAKLDAFNKPSAETTAVGQLLSDVLTDPAKHGFADSGEVMEKLVPLTSV